MPDDRIIELFVSDNCENYSHRNCNISIIDYVLYYYLTPIALKIDKKTVLILEQNKSFSHSTSRKISKVKEESIIRNKILIKSNMNEKRFNEKIEYDTYVIIYLEYILSKLVIGEFNKYSDELNSLIDYYRNIESENIEQYYGIDNMLNEYTNRSFESFQSNIGILECINTIYSNIVNE